MDGFSVASLTSTTGTISHCLLSTITELGELARPLPSSNPAHEQVTRLSSRLQHFRQTIDQLQEALASARVITPRVRGAFQHLLPTCAHAAAVFDKEISSTGSGSGRRRPNFLVLLRDYDDFVVAYSLCFTFFLQLLTITTPHEQEAKLDTETAHTMLDDAEKAYATMVRTTERAPEVDDDDSSQAPPAYTPTASSDPSSQAEERNLSIADEKRPMQPRPTVQQVFSGSHEPSLTSLPDPSTASLSTADDDDQPLQEPVNSVQRGINSFAASFKAMTASFRPKPDPLVVPLCQAVARGDMIQAEGILRQGANINGRDEKGRTPLIAAIQSLQFSAVHILLSLGADITVRDTKKSKPPLFHAVDTGNMNLMKLLLQNGADPNEKNAYGQFFFVDAIVTAAKDTTDTIDAVAIAQLFLGHGADANTKDISGRALIIHAIQALEKNKGKLPAGVERPPPSLALIAQLLDSGADANTKDITGQPALAMALQQENMALVKMLLGRGASAKAKDITGQPLLVNAVQKGWLEMVQLLLGSGADASARDITGTATLVTAYNKLVEAGKLRTSDAAAKRDELMRMFKLLIKYGADVKVNVDYVGTQLISVVARDGDPEMMRLLIKAGADPNQAIASSSGQKSSDEETLLLYAIERRPLETVQILLDHGAKVNVADKKGRTPLISAMVSGRWDVVRLLLGRGADINALGSVSPLALAQAMGEEGVVDMLVGRGARREQVWTGDADEDRPEGSAGARPGPQQQGSGQRERRTLRKTTPPGY